MLICDNKLILKAHKEAMKLSKIYKKITEAVFREGNITVKIVNKHRCFASWVSNERTIYLEDSTNTVEFIQGFIFEMINAFHTKEFDRIHKNACDGHYETGKLGMPELNFARAFEEVEYKGMRMCNSILQEILGSQYDKELWDHKQKWTIVDFDDHFLWQLQHGHSMGYVSCYQKHYKKKPIKKVDWTPIESKTDNQDWKSKFALSKTVTWKLGDREPVDWKPVDWTSSQVDWTPTTFPMWGI